MEGSGRCPPPGLGDAAAWQAAGDREERRRVGRAPVGRSLHLWSGLNVSRGSRGAAGGPAAGSASGALAAGPAWAAESGAGSATLVPGVKGGVSRRACRRVPPSAPALQWFMRLLILCWLRHTCRCIRKQLLKALVAKISFIPKKGKKQECPVCDC